MSATVSRKPSTLAELRARRDEIPEIAARRGASNIRVFGSVARGEAGAQDVDLVVDLEQGRSLLDLAGFHLDLQDLLGCDVDVGTQIKPRLREHVEAEAVPL
jgi:predicted nucleotidyltransferase